MAALFWPSTLVAISEATKARLVAITGGGTVSANAVSKAAAAVAAWPEASSALSALRCSHAAQGVAAAASASDAEPDHGPLVSAEITDRYEAALRCNSTASSSQAAAAANSEPTPGPVYIRPELISGGKSA